MSNDEFRAAMARLAAVVVLVAVHHPDGGPRAEDRRHVAGGFAMKNRVSDRLLFADLPYTRGEESGAPLMGGALSVLECRTENRVAAGDHTLVASQTLTIGLPSGGGEPLTYHQGKCRRLG